MITQLPQDATGRDVTKEVSGGWAIYRVYSGGQLAFTIEQAVSVPIDEIYSTINAMVEV